MTRRTLYRALAVVVALAALTPLFTAAEEAGGGDQLNQAAQKSGSQSR